MNYKEALIIFVSLFIIIFVIDYFFINKRKLTIINNKGIKKGKKKKVRNIGELDYLIVKFKLDTKKLDKERIIIWISIINSFIISSVSSLVMLLSFDIIWVMLIAFVLLFALIYALYEIYGRHLKKIIERRI